MKKWQTVETQSEKTKILTYLQIMRPKGGYIYIVSNKTRSTVYIGVTSNLYARIYEHKQNRGSWFTKKYKCTDLVYFEFFEHIESAIAREKQMKKWKREYKDNLINSMNPKWKDLFDSVSEMQ